MLVCWNLETIERSLAFGGKLASFGNCSCFWAVDISLLLYFGARCDTRIRLLSARQCFFFVSVGNSVIVFFFCEELWFLVDCDLEIFDSRLP